nr:MAG TPA: hypothetical protein [Caudoviricetes sp.]
MTDKRSAVLLQTGRSSPMSSEGKSQPRMRLKKLTEDTELGFLLPFREEERLRSAE